MFARLGRSVVRHPWWTILAWFVVAAAIVAFAPKLNTQTNQQSFLPSKYESVQADNLEQKAFPSTTSQDQPTIAVIKRTDGAPLTAADQQKIAQVAQELQAKGIPNVDKVVTSPQLLAKDHSIQLISISMPSMYTSSKSQTDDMNAVTSVRSALTSELSGTDLSYGVTGDIATQVDNNNSSNTSTKLVLSIAILLIIVLILAIFRSPIAAFLPIISIGLVVAVSGGATAIIGKLFNLTFDPSLGVITDVVLYGIGTDYILFLLFRYRERLRLGEDKKTAMITTVERTGEAISSAAGAVIIAFLVLVLASFKSLGNLGPELAISVAVMLVTALTLIPAVVSLLGRVVFWPSRAWKKQPKERAWARIGGSVGRRPVIYLAASGLLLVVLAASALAFKADYDFNASYPQNTQSAKAMKELDKVFPAGALTPTTIMLQGKTPISSTELGGYVQKLTHAPGVGQVESAQLNADHTVAKINVFLTQNPNSNQAIATVKGPLRDYAHAQAPPGTKALVGGTTAAFADINSANNRDLSVIIPVAVLLIGLILALLLRAVVAPIYLVVAVLLGFTATLGASVILFQGLESKPGLIFDLPTVLYLFVLAIGTDYNILMIARLREESRNGNEPREAVKVAIRHAGPTVAAAGIILAGTFGALAVSPISTIAEIGFGVGMGIVLSAFVVSTFFVPSITALLGHRAWWPGHGDRARKPQVPDSTPRQLISE